MNVLIDTDVLIDLALGRKPHDEPAAHLVQYLAPEGRADMKGGLGGAPGRDKAEER